jgi:hypothetical protein
LAQPQNVRPDDFTGRSLITSYVYYSYYELGFAELVAWTKTITKGEYEGKDKSPIEWGLALNVAQRVRAWQQWIRLLRMYSYYFKTESPAFYTYFVDGVIV